MLRNINSLIVSLLFAYPVAVSIDRGIAAFIADGHSPWVVYAAYVPAGMIACYAIGFWVSHCFGVRGGDK